MATFGVSVAELTMLMRWVTSSAMMGSSFTIFAIPSVSIDFDPTDDVQSFGCVDVESLRSRHVSITVLAKGDVMLMRHLLSSHQSVAAAPEQYVCSCTCHFWFWFDAWQERALCRSCSNLHLGWPNAFAFWLWTNAQLHTHDPACVIWCWTKNMFQTSTWYIARRLVMIWIPVCTALLSTNLWRWNAIYVPTSHASPIPMI